MPGKIIYTILVLLTFETALAAHSTVFSASLTRNIPLPFAETCDVYQYEGFINECRWKYLVWLAIWLVIALALTIIGMSEQKVLQTLSTILRFVIIGLMFLTAVIALITDSPLRPITDPTEDPSFSFDGLGRSMSIVGFAAGYCLVVPPINRLLKDKNDALGAQFWTNIMITFLLLIVGIVVGYELIGTEAPSQSSLAWAGYNAGLDPRPWWTFVIEYVIILFPAINVLSTAPITAIAVAGNYVQFLENKSQKMIVLFRVLTWVPPALVAIATHELGLIAAISGIPGYFIYYACSSIVHLGLLKRTGNMKSPFSGWYSSKILSWIAIIFCCIATVFNILRIGA
jgi:hypothetical protein